MCVSDGFLKLTWLDERRIIVTNRFHKTKINRSVDNPKISFVAVVILWMDLCSSTFFQLFQDFSTAEHLVHVQVTEKKILPSALCLNSLRKRPENFWAPHIWLLSSRACHTRCSFHWGKPDKSNQTRRTVEFFLPSRPSAPLPFFFFFFLFLHAPLVLIRTQCQEVRADSLAVLHSL